MVSETGGSQQADTHNPFQLKQPHEILSKVSGEPLSDFRKTPHSSVISRCSTNYDATLVQWETRVADDCQDEIQAALTSKMKEVKWAGFFSSDRQTMLYIQTNENETINRNCFVLGQKRKGGNTLTGCHCPVPWTTKVNSAKVRSLLEQFFVDSSFHI